ncbi:MAG TPA: TonB-dependent receptor [Gemmatimonadales bacterium]|nr:TonB-dependent receptor [Gemmatimonadales bacterium]
MRRVGDSVGMSWLALTTLVLVGTAPLGAQAALSPDTTLPAGTIVGSVVAAETSIPLEAAVVVLEPAPGGALPAPAHGSSFLQAGRAARTDANGAYRFDGLAGGNYTLHVQRLGYRPATIEIDLQSQSPFRVSVGLVVLPIMLEPVEVTGPAPPLALRMDPDSAAEARLAAQADLRRRFLVTDARSLTNADMLEAVTLGETDLFRALQRLPSVTTRDDYSAELWTRGSRWTDTRVTFDGLPLFSPLHVGGVFAGVDPDVIGSAFFLPGVRPASSAEGDAATLDLATRPAMDPGFHAVTELSMISARTVLEHAAGSGPRWVLGLRRSYVDLATSFLGAVENDSTIPVPYAFTDIAGRLDVPLGSGRALEVSGLMSRDAVHGTVPHLLQRSRGNWGDGLLRASLVTPLSGLTARFTAGVSEYDVQVEDTSAVPDGGSGALVPFPAHTQSGIRYDLFEGVFAPSNGGDWTAGYQIVFQHLDYAGPSPTSQPDSGLAPPVREFTGATQVVALWGERPLKPAAKLTLKPGLRLELGPPLANLPEVRIAPRLEGRYTVATNFIVSAGYGRTFQYAQAVGPAGSGVGPELHLSDVWLLAGDTVPAIRADVVTAGVEYSIGGWITALDVYRRYATGVAVPDPTPGPFLATRPLFVSANNLAQGAEASVRRLAGPWTASASVTVSRSDLMARGYRYPAPNDRRVVLHATLLFRAAPELHVGGALTSASGAPFTRFIGSIETWQPSLMPYATLPYAAAPGGSVAPGYTSLDVLVDWTHAAKGWTLGAFLQLRNALGATNAVTYAGSVEGCVGGAPPSKVQVAPGVCDYYVRSVERIPLAGLRVSF